MSRVYPLNIYTRSGTGMKQDVNYCYDSSSGLLYRWVSVHFISAFVGNEGNYWDLFSLYFLCLVALL